jgi:hypothetical protein
VPDAGRADTSRSDSQIPDDGTDDRTPDGWTPDGWTPDGWTPGTDWMDTDMVDTDRRRTHGALAFPTAATTPYRWDAVRKLGRPDAACSISNQDSSTERTLPRRPGHRRDQTAAGNTLPSSRRLGALLSSDDFGSSVERDGGRHPLWRGVEEQVEAGGLVRERMAMAQVVDGGR